jgi:hypothetical protein
VFAFDGNAVLQGKGVLRAGFNTSATGAGESEYDGTGTLRVSTAITADSSADGLFMFDANKVLRATVNQNSGAQAPFVVALVDAKGVGRASIFENSTVSGFAAHDATGVAGAAVVDNVATGSGFVLLDGKNVVRGFLGATPTSSNPSLGINDSGGKSRAALIISSDQSIVNFSLFDKNGNTTGIGSNPTNEGFFAGDSHGTTRAALGLVTALNPFQSFLAMSDTAGSNELYASVTADGSNAAYVVKDPNGTTRIAAYRSGAFTGLQVYDLTGKTIVGQVPEIGP